MQKILDWSEAWAVTIPLIVYLLKRPKEKYLKPVFLYLLIAFLLNTAGDVIVENYYHEPAWIVKINYNQSFYNFHSIVRMFLLIYFFSLLNIPSQKKIRTILFFAAALFIIINFSFFISFKNLSSATFALEGVVIIFYCILFFLKQLKSDEISSQFDASLYIVTGLAIYEAVSFPIFLFYQTLTEQTKDYAVNIWDVHNIVYIVFCLFIARSFYGSTRRTNN